MTTAGWQRVGGVAEWGGELAGLGSRTLNPLRSRAKSGPKNLIYLPVKQKGGKSLTFPNQG